jgi:GNAT superfamily N-acetyltransferase
MWASARYQPEDLPETIEMTQEQYGESWISDLGFLRWQYEANPAGPAVARLARDSDSRRLAGQYVVIPMRFEADGIDMRGVLSLNTLTREAYRGQGVFTGLAESTYQDCQDQGFAFCYGFPNPDSYPGFVRKLGFTDIGRVPLLLRPLNVRSIVRRRFGSSAAALAAPAGIFYRTREHADYAHEVGPLGLADLGDIAAFWGRVRAKYPIMGVRDAAFFRWRYFDIPLREYLVHGVRRKNGTELLGYAVGRCTEVQGMQAGMIVDVLVVEGLPRSAGRALVGSLLRDFAARGAELAGSLMLPHTEESRLLKAAGFLTCPRSLEPQPFPVIYRRLKNPDESSPDPLADLSRWFLTMGDYDVI